MNIDPEQTPQPSPNTPEDAIIEQVLRLSLEISNSKTFSKANALPHTYYKRIKSMKMGHSKQSCTVCLQEFCQNQLIKRLPCGHILHNECAKGWLKVNRRCPLCRMDLELHFRTIEQPPVTEELLS